MSVTAARIRTAVLAGALTVGLSVAAVAPAQAAPGAPAAGAPAAAARKLPVAYLGNMDGPWGRPSVRPREFFLGADWVISRMKWSSWTQRRAAGHGTYDACAGAAGPCTKFYAGITLTVVKVHHGTRYFAHMKITGKHRKAMYLVMSTKWGWWVPK
jgi:hypothetical protein